MKLLAISLCVYVILWGFLSTGSSEAIEDFYEEFDDFEIDLTGANLSPKKQSNPMKISVKFENTYTDDTIGLYWISDRGEEILIADIPPLSSSNVDTTVSHTFTGRLKKDGTKAEPSLVIDHV